MKLARIACPEAIAVWASSPMLRMYLGEYRQGDTFVSTWQEFNSDWNWVLAFQDYLCNVDSPEYDNEVKNLKAQFPDGKITYSLINTVEL
jgi:hypothetical protein